MRTTPLTSLAQIESRMIANILEKPVDTAIFAGHQVVRDRDSYVDLGCFPEKTWQSGWNIIGRVQEENSAVRIRIFTLINDWQCLRESRTNEGNQKIDYWMNPEMRLRESELPDKREFLLEGMSVEKTPLDPDRLAGRISESKLQTRFKHKLNRVKGRREAFDEALKEVRIPDAQSTCRVSGCTSEFLELVPFLRAQNFRRLISFIPTTCRGHISAACKILETGLLEEGNPSEFSLHNYYLNSGFMGTSNPPESEEELFCGASEESFQV
jgi:hypothetical protein